MSDGTPDPGELAIGEHLAGYRLDAIIARGGMAVVYRAFDERLGRSVALKVLAAPLARDEAFRRRFIRESRIAAAVDHPNILPVFEAGEANGVLFIATRLVPGRDVLSLLEEQSPLPAARVCHIVTQVAAALDAAHERGLVHRDVKPANMLRDAAAGEDYPDHIYLADFGLSKHGRSASQLTSYGEFLGTMDYVSPEQIEGRPVGGQSDQYALACSTFEMLTGAPPFKQDETLAIMWAQVSSTPPAATSRRPELPEAVDAVLAKALAKVPADRYGSCLEFAAALRRACGLGGAAPGPVPPDPGQEPADTAIWGAAPAAAAAAVPEPAGAEPPVPEPVAAEPEPVTLGPEVVGPVAAEPEPVTLGPGVVEPAAPPLAAPPLAEPLPMTVLTPRAPSPPARRPPPAGPPGYRLPPGTQPRSRRSRVAVLVTCVALLGLIGGAYLAFGGGAGPRTRAAAALALPGCTTGTAAAATVRNVPQFTVPTGGKPFDVVVTAKGYGFVSLTKGLAVLRATGSRPAVLQNFPLASALGEALTHDQRYLLVAGQHGLRVFRVRDLVHGLSAPVGTLTSPGKHPVQVAVSPDDRFAFVTYQFSRAVAVFNLGKALTAGFGPGDLVGQVPVRSNPIGIAASPDGRYLYVASGLATPARESGMGSLSVIDLRKAETSPRASVLRTISAGCGPDRVVVSGDGQTVWVSAGGGNAVVAFSAAKLLTEPGAALEARVAVGQLPLGLALVDQGARLIVADSNRDGLRGSAASLAVVNVRKALARKPALAGFIKAGGTPRQFALEPGGGTLLVADTAAGRIQAVKTGRLP